ncbi:Crp/Fnr family transcriptional regulator [Chryseobacterium luteum]|uniref:Cyclic nucleotide-binding protein n=1 Tax=Chryseobacterium luteum TaxID=421531 RepID=A0A085ZDP8_9FLAO|nr:Crp/Fnr family transcriptional regulator [Chryseobacterium luteum]KFF02562.1 cyclic nucleotide-binding protein [Chryseobacterium luteum]
MHQPLFEYIERYGKTALSNEEKLLIQAAMEPIQIKKKDYFLKEGKTCEHAAFIINGALRMFSVDENGIEHILQLYVEDWWAVDMNSYMKHEPSHYFIEAWEDAKLLVLPIEKFDEILEIPAFKAMFWHINQNHHIASHKRRDNALNLSAKKRYENYSLLYPQIVQRFPLSHVASYLGITRETLSRLKKHF